MQEILEELFRRCQLIKAIDAVIDELFDFGAPKRIKRGRVQKAIASRLGLVLNNHTAILINERVKAKGGRPYLFHGGLYFKGVTEKPQAPKHPEWEW